MNENRWFRDFALLFLERAFPRTFLVLEEGEKARLAREFAPVSGKRDLKHFAEFLESKKWPAAQAFLPELAKVEFAIKLAGIAPELAQSGFENVVSASEPEWYEARFRFDPAHVLFESCWDLAAIYETPRGEYLPGERAHFLVYRHQGRASIRQIDENEAALIRSLSLGVPLGRVLERARGPEFDAFIFHRWIDSGLLRVIEWTTPSPGTQDSLCPEPILG